MDSLVWTFGRWLRDWRLVTALGVVVAAAVVIVVVRTTGTPAARSAEDEAPRGPAMLALADASTVPLQGSATPAGLEAVRMAVAVEGQTPAARARAFIEEHAGVFELAPGSELVVDRIDGPSDEVVGFVQRWRNLPVFGAELAVSLLGDKARASSGRLLRRAPASHVPEVSVEDAEAAALGADRDGEPFGDTAAAAAGHTGLVVYDASLLHDDTPADPRLAYRVRLVGTEPATILVDALNATVLEVVGEAAAGEGLEDYDVDFEDAENDSNSWEDNCYWDSDETYVGDEDGLVPGYLDNQDAITAWFGARDVYLYYHDAFGRHSIDGDDVEVEIYINAKGLNGGAVAQPACDMLEFATGNPRDTDIVGHEWTHKVIDHTSDIIYQAVPGAINESFADIFASRVDGNFLIREDAPNGAIRNMANPPQYGDPDHLSSELYVTTSDDWGGVHTNSGIQNKVFTLLVLGATHNGQTVPQMGPSNAAAVAYWSMVTMPANASWVVARNQWVAVAGYLGTGIPGPNLSDEHVCSVIRAWAAVGVGPGDEDCDGTDDGTDDDDGDGLVASLDNCPSHANPTQADLDDDGRGDPCDPDLDGDGVPNGNDVDGDGQLEFGEPPLQAPLGDNCPHHANPDQLDANFNGIGKVCDPSEDGDIDDDGVDDEADNCPHDANPDQADVDGDGDGDACDPDTDGDGVSNNDDNCPFTANEGQADTDGDWYGDACDGCPETADTNQAWTAGLQIGDQFIPPEPLQPDSDSDGIPDLCDDNTALAAATGAAVSGNVSILALGNVGPAEGGPGLGSSLVGSLTFDSTGAAMLPFPGCLGSWCDDPVGPWSRLELSCATVPGGIRLSVFDNEGDGLGAAPRSSPARLRWRANPVAGAWLRIDWSEQIAGGPIEWDVDCTIVPVLAMDAPPGAALPGPRAVLPSEGSSPSATATPSAGPSPEHSSGAPEPSPSQSEPVPPTPSPTKPPTPSPTPSPTPNPTPTLTLECVPTGGSGDEIVMPESSRDELTCTVRSSGGFEGQVVLRCGPLPAHITACNPSPTSSQTVAQGRDAEFTVGLTSGAVDEQTSGEIELLVFEGRTQLATDDITVTVTPT